MKLWVTNIYTATESNCINLSKINPARGTELGSTVSVMSCDSSLGCPHEAPARGRSPCRTLQREQLELLALLPVPRCLRGPGSQRWHLSLPSRTGALLVTHHTPVTALRVTSVIWPQNNSLCTAAFNSTSPPLPLELALAWTSLKDKNYYSNSV